MFMKECPWGPHCAEAGRWCQRAEGETAAMQIRLQLQPTPGGTLEPEGLLGVAPHWGEHIPDWDEMPGLYTGPGVSHWKWAACLREGRVTGEAVLHRRGGWPPKC